MPSPAIKFSARTVRTILLALFVAAAFTVVTAKRVSAAGGGTCKDFTPDQRPCTASEALGFSLNAAFGAS